MSVADDEDGEAEDPHAEDSSTSTGQHSSQSQPTLSQFINQKKTWDPNSVQSKKITHVIGRNFKLIYFYI